MSWLSRNWRKVAGIVVGATGVLYPPLLPVTIGIGGLVAGSDFQIGAQLGTPIGKAAKELVNGRR